MDNTQKSYTFVITSKHDTSEPLKFVSIATDSLESAEVWAQDQLEEFKEGVEIKLDSTD